ncbi:hypothetical protein DA075_17655 [Methylobacterium currus]|uniref:Uncharacterized protein n=1 Tax=Methylobacterium currus TaxID=2051553 RepID=A0A2R4WLT8_9HYPH|nr:hypothetical protein [Methylobacterium currus]AWB22512.1 hypothetical protein DA075_17655 [Methylobacterium currus]
MLDALREDARAERCLPGRLDGARAALLVLREGDREGGDAGGDQDRQPDDEAELLAQGEGHGMHQQAI